MWYENAMAKLQHGEKVQRSELISILEEERSGLSKNSYIWVIGNLVKDGLLVREGRNQYTIAGSRKKSVYVPHYSDAAKKVQCEVEERYPNIDFTVFESFLLNEFLNHQIARNTIFLQAERETNAFIFEFLKETRNDTVMYRPSVKEYSRYWKPDSVIILDCTSEAPLNLKCPHDITIEKMIVDVFCDKTIRLTYSSAEYSDLLKTAYDRYKVDTVRLLRYARRRNKENEIRQYIPGI